MNSTNFVDKHWILYFRGHAAVISTNFMDKHWIPLFSWTSYNDFHYFLEKPASSAVNVHFFRGIKKSFSRTRATTITTNKPFLRSRQRSLVVKNHQLKQQTVMSFGQKTFHSRHKHRFCRKQKRKIKEIASLAHYWINFRYVHFTKKKIQSHFR